MILAASLSITDLNERNIVTKQFIRGFEDTCRKADTFVTGGQTVLNPWPLIGGVAKTICKAEDIIMPVSARVGDVVVLTKPLGTQIAVNVMQWTHKEAKWKDVDDLITKEQAYRAFHVAEESMCRLNRTAA